MSDIIPSMRRVKLTFEVRRPVLACGADTKGAFALARGKTAFLFDGFGDLSDPDNLKRYAGAIERAIRQLRIKPAVVVCDLHPDYFSTRFARQIAGDGQLEAVQHHEAHVAACMVDNALSGKVVGVAFDGTGYGSDGTVWGGEFLAGSIGKLQRQAHLESVAMPGAEAAVRHPWRMAASYIYNATGRCGDANIRTMVDRSVNSPLTSSAGRLFDSVGSMILCVDDIVKEAQIPIELEAIASWSCDKRYDFKVCAKAGQMTVRTGDIITGVLRDKKKGLSKPLLSAKFHNTVARIISDVSGRLAKRIKTKDVVLSGGVFLNRYLTTKVLAGLAANGLKAYKHANMPTGDECIPVGQIAIASQRG